MLRNPLRQDGAQAARNGGVQFLQEAEEELPETDVVVALGGNAGHDVLVVDGPMKPQQRFHDGDILQ